MALIDAADRSSRIRPPDERESSSVDAFEGVSGGSEDPCMCPLWSIYSAAPTDIGGGSMRRVAPVALCLILPALLVGCSETQLVTIYEQPSIVGQPDALGATQWEDEFQQRTIAASDILFAIDDSCSMSDEQESLANNFDAFISNFVGTNLDYHIGVTRAALSGGNNPFDPGNPDEWGYLDSASDGARWLSGDTPDIVTEFNDMANVGTNGGDCEMALQATFSALQVQAAPGGYNEGFYRDDAHLTLVLLSDENDHGFEQPPPPLGGCNGIRPDEYSDWLLGLKGPNDRDKISFTAIVGGDNGCGNSDSGADPAPNYMEVVDRVDGNFLSICDADWSTFLTELGLEASGLKRSFQLRRIPVESTLVLTIDGVEPDASVWSYDRPSNSIDFPIEHVPAELAIVRVEYELQEDTGVVVPPLDE
jgi:hypothetical protein